MSLQIAVKDWKVVKRSETINKVVAGTYAVMNGPIEIATKCFNDGGCSSVNIEIPADIMIEIERIDQRIRNVIAENFGAV
jgi:hypothetical protein